MIRWPWRGDVDEPEPAPPAAQAEPAASWARGVLGERAKSIASGARSLQSRMTGLLAAGLMISVGAGMLAWYYTEALSRPARAPVHPSVPQAAGEGVTLPPFGPAASPPTRSPAASVRSEPSPPTTAALRPSNIALASPVATPSASSLLESQPLDRAPGGLPQAYGVPPPPSSRQQALDRRLSGEVFASGGSSVSSSNTAAGGIDEAPISALPAGGVQTQGPTALSRGDPLQALLRPSVLGATRAQLLPTQRLLLPKGSFIDCTLETAIDSTLPGMTTCITATDTFGADGTVVLLERGTKLVGETRGEVHQGEARVFVVWTEARTPAGVVVRLDSPGTDALGRSGLAGKVNRHFWQRFGAAALVSTIDGVVQSEVQSSSRGGTVVLDPTASEDVLTEILRGTVNIPPTIRVRNGARIQVLVARDVDFRPVYDLQPR